MMGTRASTLEGSRRGVASRGDLGTGTLVDILGDTGGETGGNLPWVTEENSPTGGEVVEVPFPAGEESAAPLGTALVRGR